MAWLVAFSFNTCFINLSGIPLPIANAMNILENNFALQAEYINRAIDFVGSEATDFIQSSLKEGAKVTPAALYPSRLASDSAYAGVKHILQSCGYWDSIAVACGLQKIAYRGEVAWISRDADTVAQFKEACDLRLTSSGTKVRFFSVTFRSPRLSYNSLLFQRLTTILQCRLPQ